MCSCQQFPVPLQLEMERLLVKQFVLENAERLHSPEAKTGKLRYMYKYNNYYTNER